MHARNATANAAVRRPLTAPAATRRPWVDWELAIPAAVTLAVMLWGIRIPPYWGDEVDTVSAVSRSLPQLIRLLGHTDAMHGLYYLLLWPVARVAGTGEVATRLPSALAMTAAALGVSAIARRLRSRRAALCAGLVFAALPAVTQQGHDARPYAMLTAAVVLASYLLLGLTDDLRPGRFAGYGLARTRRLSAGAGAAHRARARDHAARLAAPGRHVRRRRPVGPGGAPGLAAGVAAVGALSAPVAVMAWLQRGSFAWIKEPGWYDFRYLLAFLAGGSVLSAVVMAVLAAAAAIRGAHQLPGLALPWLVVPPALLWAVSFLQPAYSARYVTFCLPATALLVGAALAALRTPVAATALGLLVALSVPGPLGQWAVRVSGGSTGAAAIQAASQFLAAHERSGDAVVYPGSSSRR